MSLFIKMKLRKEFKKSGLSPLKFAIEKSSILQVKPSVILKEIKK